LLNKKTHYWIKKYRKIQDSTPLNNSSSW